MPHKSYKRSRKDYPQGVLAIYDNHGQSNESGDRYMVVFEPIEHDPVARAFTGRNYTFPILTMSDDLDVCIHGEVPHRPTGGWQSGSNSAGKTIPFEALPEACQRAVKRDLIPPCTQCYGLDGEHLNRDCVAPWHVGLVDAGNGTGTHLGAFETEALAASYIETLPNHEDGRYYLDGPADD